MPLYEYHCSSCRSTFELLRPINRAGDDATCPAGHPKAVKLLSLVAQRPRSSGEATPMGGCACGGSCSCGG
jgi:putative FmdB family regulatory protein